MSFQLTTYPGTGAKNTEDYHYSQAVRVNLSDVIETSGQGGWDENGTIDPDIRKQVEKAFENAMTAVQASEPSATWKVRSWYKTRGLLLIEEERVLCSDVSSRLGRDV